MKYRFKTTLIATLLAGSLGVSSSPANAIAKPRISLEDAVEKLRVKYSIMDASENMRARHKQERAELKERQKN